MKKWNSYPIISMGSSVAIVGAGRVGRGLARRLHELGWTVGAVISRRESSARSAVRMIGAGHAHAGLTRQVLTSEVILISTPDNAMPGVAADLAQIGGAEWKDKIVLHTSGALDRSVLAPLAARGAATGSLHPLQTFSGRGVPPLEGVIFAIEGDSVALRKARAIAQALGGEPVTLTGRDKPAYHAAGAFVAGRVLAVMEAATRILMEMGFTRRRAIQALLPLVHQMLDNFEHFGPRAAWTGPLSRGDYDTVAKHIQAMERFPREIRDAYIALTRLAACLLTPQPEETLRRVDGLLRKPKGSKS